MKHLTPKPLAITLLILVILGLGFLSVFIPYLPKVQAHNPIITLTNTSSCSTPNCGNAVNEFGLVTSFNPATSTGLGLINMLYCTSASTSPTIVTSITDTISDVWTQIIGIPTSAFHGSNTEESYQAFEWYTNVASTGSTSFTITANFSPASSYCEFTLSLVSYGITPLNNQVTAGFQVQRGNSNLTSTVVTSPINSLIFVSTWSNYTNGFQSGNLVLGLSQYESTAICPQTSCITQQQFYGFYTAQVTRPFLISHLTQSSNNPQGFGFIATIYNINTIFAPTCQNNTCQIAGGGITPGTTQFTLTANETYYYVANSGIGGVTIQNLTSKIDSYNNANPGKQYDTVNMMIYRQSSSTTGTSPPISIANPLNLIATVSVNNIATGTFANWFHAPSSLSIIIPSNTLYAVGIESIFSGLGLYQALNAQPMYEQPVLISSTSSTWAPPQQITQQILQSPQLFFSWYGIQGVFNVVSTSTFTSVATCTASQVCTTASSTIYNTNTAFTYVRPVNQTNIADIQDVETYFPIWVLPLIFSPFGIQGILIGLAGGVILGAILGIIPLWAAFVLSLGITYVLYKRG